MPDDIIFLILSNLPVKSLVRLSSVCKSWRTLIFNDEEFARSHLKRATADNDRHGELLILSISSGGGKYNEMWQDYDLTPADDDQVIIKSRRITRIPIHTYLYPASDYGLAGYCDGLVCIYQVKIGHYECYGEKFNAIYIWNPALHQSRALPPKRSRGFGFDFLGFGCDTKKQDYKVVKIFASCKPEIYIDMYSLKNNCWESIALSFPPHVYNIARKDGSHYSLDFNGCLHWIAEVGFIVGDDHERVSTHSLLAFDIANENFNLIRIPSSLSGYQTTFDYLGVLNGFLTFIACVDENRWEVWSMKTYGLDDTWIKLVFFPDRVLDYKFCNAIGIYRYDKIPTIKVCRKSDLVGINRNGKILLKDWHSVFTYDQSKGTCLEETKFEMCERRHNLHHNHYFVADYVESLISIMPPTSPAVDDGSFDEKSQQETGDGGEEEAKNVQPSNGGQFTMSHLLEDLSEEIKEAQLIH